MRWFGVVVQFAMLGVAVTPVLARSPERETIPVSIAWDVGFGSNVCVVGNHWDLGAWSPTNSIKLRWTTGNVWTGQVAVQRGTDLAYKFIGRDGASSRYGDAANVRWEAGADRTMVIDPAPAAPMDGKTVFYYSGWTSAALVVISGTNTSSVAMQAIGPGRSAGETLYRADGVGEAGEGLEFVPTGWFGGQNFWDNPPYADWNNNYYTLLDACLLQDGQIYNYWPTSSVSPPRMVTTLVNSTAAGIPARTNRIYLPRGYDSHAWRRYPVMYMHDGQNVFDPGGAFGSWSADAIATREISQGRMRETIIVAIDNTAIRRSEYEPAGDTYFTGEAPGVGDAYLRYLIDNVRPTLDVNYRTLNDPRNTLVGGSSMGGLISVYCGFETNVFGAVLAMSPAMTRAPNYTAALWTRARRPGRIYLDTGTQEGNVGPGVGNYWEKPWEAYDLFLAQGYAVNDELRMVAGVGDQHNEAAWKRRLPGAFRFLLDVRDEPNLLAQQTWPPRVAHDATFSALSCPSLRHFSYHLDAITNGSLAGAGWQDAQASARETNPWSTVTFALPGLPAGANTGFFRVQAVPAP